MNKPLILCITDGIGISSSWSGNAFLSSNPENIKRLINNYPSGVITPPFSEKSGAENKEIDFARLMTGQNVISDKKLIDLLIKGNELRYEKNLTKYLRETAERNAALHLIGTVSNESEEYSSTSHLLNILDLAKDLKVYRIFLHLLADDTKESDFKSSLEDLVSKLSEYDMVEISSVTGLSFLDNKSNSIAMAKAISAIFFGKGRKAIDPIQSLNKGKSKKIEPSSVLYQGQFNREIRSFDSILFFNHNNKNISRFISIVSKNIVARLPMPKFIEYASMFSPFESFDNNIKVLFQRNFKKNILQTASNEAISTLALTDNDGLSNFNYLSEDASDMVKIFDYNCEGSIERYKKVLAQIISEISEQKEYFKFFVIYLPTLRYVESKPFKNVTATAKETDNFIGGLAKLAETNDFSLILTSCTGGSEKISGRSDFEKMNNKSLSPTPFLLIDKEYKKEVVAENDQFYDMMKRKISIFDVYPIVMEMLGLSDTQKSESIIKKLIKK